MEADVVEREADTAELEADAAKLEAETAAAETGLLQHKPSRSMMGLRPPKVMSEKSSDTVPELPVPLCAIT